MIIQNFRQYIAYQKKRCYDSNTQYIGYFIGGIIIPEIITKSIRAIPNAAKKDGNGPTFLSTQVTENVRRIHNSLDGYQPTPLIRLDGMAKALGVKAIYVKDESCRFGLKAFKALGGLYALFWVVCQEFGLNPETTNFADLKSPVLREQVKKLVFVTATDGNHGKGIAWAAGQLGCKAHIYMPKGSSEVRAQAIRDVGKAEVSITKLGYDDAVRYAAEMAKKNGWHLVQDTSWYGYEETPKRIIQGYTTMAAEAIDQLIAQGFECPTHVFLQAGVGAMAGGVLGYLVNHWEMKRPAFCIVEPENAACIYRSAQVADGEPHSATGCGQTIMAGLNCGEPCTITWPILRDFADWYFSCPDYTAAYGMRLFGAPEAGDSRIISGESGAVTAGLLNLLMRKEDCRELAKHVGLNESSVVLLFSTEGDTDPVHYRQVVWDGEMPVPHL